MDWALSNLRKASIPSLWLIFLGVLVNEWVFIFMSRGMSLFGKYINLWYTKFGLYAILSDVASIMIGMMIADWLYTGTNYWAFMGTAVAVQWVHDILFYLGIILPMPEGVNAVIDLLKPYSRQAGFLAVLGDSWMMIGGLLFAKALQGTSTAVQIFTLFLSVYMLPYAVFQTKA
jgi:hypothetical protein